MNSKRRFENTADTGRKYPRGFRVAPPKVGFLCGVGFNIIRSYQ
jgi:hypothetical protein